MTTGTVVVTETTIKQVRKVSFAWTSTSGGAAGETTRFRYTGKVLAVCTVPGTSGDAPDDNYDIRLLDADNVDVANGQLANRHTSTTQWVFASLGHIVHDKMTIEVTNAGSANTGTCHVFIGSGELDSFYEEIRDALIGTVGVTTFPAAAAPANGVSMAEVERSIWAGLMGTAAGENGITTWPAAAAPANAVSIAEAIRYIVESQIGALTNSGGTATLTGILGDVANSSIATRLTNIANQTVRASTIKTPSSMATGNLFTIAGGPVRVLSVVGQITTALEAKANAIKLVHTPTGGAGVDLCATVESNAAAIRKCFVLNGVKATALQITTDIGVVTLANQNGMPIVLTPGVISLNAADTATGVVSWHVEYEPLVAGATVVAA